jgi:hypothetical protein
MGFRPDPYLAGLSAYRQQKRAADFQGVIGWINHWTSEQTSLKTRMFLLYCKTF